MSSAPASDPLNESAKAEPPVTAKPAPQRAIRARCLDCSGWCAGEVRECERTACALWPYRIGKPSVRLNLSRLRAIRAKCLDCCLSNANEVRLCPARRCPLWPWRSGKRPAKVGKPLVGGLSGASSASGGPGDGPSVALAKGLPGAVFKGVTRG